MTKRSGFSPDQYPERMARAVFDYSEAFSLERINEFDAALLELVDVADSLVVESRSPTAWTTVARQAIKHYGRLYPAIRGIEKTRIFQSANTQMQVELHAEAIARRGLSA